jgi:retron-type reverse transcriptase
MLQAGYLEDWEWNATLSGVPQGGVVSPVLSNIYLDRMDKFAETILIPEYTRGQVRAKNPGYRRTESAVRRARRRGDRAAARELLLRQRSMPSMDPQDPGYRRLRYTRYADLCRRRHKSAYADIRVMPTGLLEGLYGGQAIAS